jgi:protein-L-isoaspartate(D-aspartate) O-methyltransferase
MAWAAENGDDRAREREEMVAEQIAARGINDERVLAAMRKVPRHLLVPVEVAAYAYQDMPLPIGGGKTISQPYIVAAMTDLAAIGPESRVLEIGTGSGYQAVVAAELAREIYSIEIDERLAKMAADVIPRLGYRNIHLRQGDGFGGWLEAAPFDAVLVTAAPPYVPPALCEQLKIGGRLVIPVGDRRQELRLITRIDETSFASEHIFPVQFVPMTGAAQQPRTRH